MQRRLIQVFKEFLENAILPEAQSGSQLATACQEFTTLLSATTVDIGALESIAGSFTECGPNGSPFEQLKLQRMFSKKKDEITSENSAEPPSFNPSKTFGGQRARFNMFQTKKSDPNRESVMNTSETKLLLSSHATKSLASIQNIYRAFLDNQDKLQLISKQQPFSSTARALLAQGRHI